MICTSENNLKKEYDAIIIGGGLGGMTCANILAKKFSYKVLIVEKHIKLGGLATWFNRKGHIFNVSLHGFPHAMIKTCKKYWTDEIAEKIIPIKRIRFQNPQFSLSTIFDSNDYTDLLIKHFKIKKEIVYNFFKTLNTIDSLNDEKITTREFFESFFPGRNDVFRMLLEPITYANGSNLDDPAITFQIVFTNFMNGGVFTFNTGTDRIIKKMQDELLKNGVDIGLSCKAEKLIFKKKNIAGCIVNGEEIKCKCVISDGNLKTTVKELAGVQNFKPSFIQHLDKVRFNDSSCQVYIGIKEDETIDEIEDIILFSNEKKFEPEKLSEFNTKSRSFSIYSPKKMRSIKKHSVVSSTNARYEDWLNLNRMEYKKAKADLCESTLQDLEHLIPGIRNKIDYIEASTPITFRRYAHSEKGSSFGTKFEGLNISKNLNKHISGLFHTGSTGIIMSGWLGTANYGVINANNVDKFLRYGKI